MRNVLVASVIYSAIFAQQNNIPDNIQVLIKQYSCDKCHLLNEKSIGPSYLKIAEKKYKPTEIVHLIFNPNPANWATYPPMTAMPQVKKKDAMKIAKWITTLN